MLDYGPALIEHVLIEHGFAPNSRIGTQFDINRDVPKLHMALLSAENILKSVGTSSKVYSFIKGRNSNYWNSQHLIIYQGYIIQKRETRPATSIEDKEFLTNQEFHPLLYKQHEALPFLEVNTFNQAVDEFFSKMESQKLDLRVVQQVGYF